MGKKLVQCPNCKFTNRFGDATCLICKGALPQDEADRNVPQGLEESLDKSRDLRQTQRFRRVGEQPTQTSVKRRTGGGPGSGTQRRPSARIPIPTEDETEKIVAWLCCDPLPPIPLGLKPVLTLGRADTCDLVLPHKEVSRAHGMIKIRAGVIVYEDEGSSNGSYLNGKRVNSSIVKEGDRLTLGPYELEVRSRETMDDKPSEDTTSNLDLTSVARVKPSAAMTGLLEEVPMSEILQQIEFNKKTGTLTVWRGLVQGDLTFRDGLPLTASFDGLIGTEAALAMIELREGRFSLGPEIEIDDVTISSTLTGLLLEASRRIDEATEEVDPPPRVEIDDAVFTGHPTPPGSEGPDPSISDVASGWGHLDDED